MPTLAPVVTVTPAARSVTVRVTALVAGPVLVRAAVCGAEHGLEVLVRLPGPRAAHHTALLVELGQHAALAQHSLQLGSGALANTLTISVTGDTVGPLLLGELQPPVTSYFNVLPCCLCLPVTTVTLLQLNCFEAVSQLSLLVSHHTHRKLRRLRIERELVARLSSAHQQTLACQLPGGGTALHFNGR